MSEGRLGASPEAPAWRSWVFDLLPAMFMDFSFYVSLVTVQFILDARGVPASLLATTVAAYAVVYMVACPSLSALLRRRIRLSVLSGAALGMACMFGFSLAEELWHYQALLALFGVAGALFWPPFQTTVAAEGPVVELPRRLAIFNFGWTSGKAGGLLLAGAMFAAFDNKLVPFYLATGLVMASFGLFVVRFYLLPWARQLTPSPEASSAKSEPAASRAGLGVYFPAALAATFLIWGGQSTVISLVPKVGRALGLDPGQSGLLLASMIACQTATFAVLKRWRAWTYNGRFLTAACAAAALSLAALPYATSMLAAVAATGLFGAAIGVAYSSSLFYALDTAEPGVRPALHEATIGLGSLLIPPVFGYLVETRGLPIAGGAYGLVALGLGLALAVVLARARRASLA